MDWKGYFNETIMDRGMAIKAENIVYETDEDGIYTARVKGTRWYDVVADTNHMLLSRCSCPYFESGEFCKHLAAVFYYLFDAGEPEDQYHEEPVISNPEPKQEGFDVQVFLSQLDTDTIMNLFIEMHQSSPEMRRTLTRHDLYKNYNNPKKDIFAVINDLVEDILSYVEDEEEDDYSSFDGYYDNYEDQYIENFQYEDVIEQIKDHMHWLILNHKVEDLERMINELIENTLLINHKGTEMQTYNWMNLVEDSLQKGLPLLPRDVAEGLLVPISKLFTTTLPNASMEAIIEQWDGFYSETIHTPVKVALIQDILNKKKTISRYDDDFSLVQILIKYYEELHMTELILPLVQTYKDNDDVILMYLKFLSRTHQYNELVMFIMNHSFTSSYTHQKVLQYLREAYFKLDDVVMYRETLLGQMNFSLTTNKLKLYYESFKEDEWHTAYKVLLYELGSVEKTAFAMHYFNDLNGLVHLVEKHPDNEELFKKYRHGLSAHYPKHMLNCYEKRIWAMCNKGAKPASYEEIKSFILEMGRIELGEASVAKLVGELSDTFKTRLKFVKMLKSISTICPQEGC